MTNIPFEIEISLILPTYREKESIRQTILEFKKIDQIKEIIVVDNNSESGTVEEIQDLNVKILSEKRQGYGWAIKRGISEANFEYVAVCEPDGTFKPLDIYKLMSYVSESDFVVGTRTNTIFIWSGANMGLFLRWGNWFVAKLTEIIFNTTYLSDVGCTFRLIEKKCALEIINRCKNNKSAFGFEMILEGFLLKKRIIQIPINYKERIGKSSVTGSKFKAFILGLNMIKMLISKRIKNPTL
jgi:glycosyltransferase involved in cell wall biosynthesis